MRSGTNCIGTECRALGGIERSLGQTLPNSLSPGTIVAGKNTQTKGQKKTEAMRDLEVFNCQSQATNVRVCGRDSTQKHLGNYELFVQTRTTHSTGDSHFLQHSQHLGTNVPCVPWRVRTQSMVCDKALAHARMQMCAHSDTTFLTPLTIFHCFHSWLRYDYTMFNCC